MSAKQIVKSFYELDLANDDYGMNYVHKDCELNWHSSMGFRILDFNGIENMLIEIRRSYETFKYRISHLLQDGNTVTIRYSINAASIERPGEPEPLAHFITIWETKEGKLYKGYEISQLADDSRESLNSFSTKH
ncbi:MAG: nuclear transport factor 2 family protein [Bacteroidota bacterium]